MLNKGFYEFYAAMDIINLHLKKEKSNQAPFVISSEEVYKALKNAIHKNRGFIDNKSYYAGKNYQNGLTGYVEELNSRVEETKGIRIL